MHLCFSIKTPFSRWAFLLCFFSSYFCSKINGALSHPLIALTKSLMRTSKNLENTACPYPSDNTRAECRRLVYFRVAKKGKRDLKGPRFPWGHTAKDLISSSSVLTPNNSNTSQSAMGWRPGLSSWDTSDPKYRRDSGSLESYLSPPLRATTLRST